MLNSFSILHINKMCQQNRIVTVFILFNFTIHTDDSGRGSVSENSANNFDQCSTYMAEQDRNCTSLSMSSKFYPDVLRPSLNAALTTDVNSGSSSIGSDSTLVAVQDNNDLVSNTQNESDWLNDMAPLWQNMYNYGNQPNGYTTNSSLQYSNVPQFQHHNYNYPGFDISYKSRDDVYSPSTRHIQQHEWFKSNDATSEGRAVIFDLNNHAQINNHGHYHPLQNVGILFNGSGNEHQSGNDDIMIRDTKGGQGQSLSKQTDKALTSKQEREIFYNQIHHPFNNNFYTNVSWKQHIGDGALATLPRRPYSAQSMYPDNPELSSSHNLFHNSRSKANLTPLSSSVTGISGLY